MSPTHTPYRVNNVLWAHVTDTHTHDIGLTTFCGHMSPTHTRYIGLTFLYAYEQKITYVCVCVCVGCEETENLSL